MWSGLDGHVNPHGPVPQTVDLIGCKKYINRSN